MMRKMPRLSITTEATEMTRKLTPIHPGEVLREDLLLPLRLSATALAEAIGVTPARISEILRGRRSITADTALRLARYFGTDAQSWLNLQARYDLELASDSLAIDLRHIQPRKAA